MHHLDTGDDAITVHVEVDGFSHAPGTTYVKTAPYVICNSSISISISIPPGAVNHLETQTCAVPSGIKSTASHMCLNSLLVK